MILICTVCSGIHFIFRFWISISVSISAPRKMSVGKCQNLLLQLKIIQLNPNKKRNFVENTQLNVLIQGVKSVGVRIGGQ